MITYTRTSARANFSEIIKQVKYGKKIISIKEDVLIVPFPEIDEKDLPISEINENSDSFNFLESEPDIYSLKDLTKRYV